MYGMVVQGKCKYQILGEIFRSQSHSCVGFEMSVIRFGYWCDTCSPILSSVLCTKAPSKLVMPAQSVRGETKVEIKFADDLHCVKV